MSVFLCSNGLLHIFIIRGSLKRERQHKISTITGLLLLVEAWLKGFVYVCPLLIHGKYKFTLYYMNIMCMKLMFSDCSCF